MSSLHSSKVRNYNSQNLIETDDVMKNRLYYYKAVVALNNAGVNLLHKHCHHNNNNQDAIDTFRDAIYVINSKFYKPDNDRHFSITDIQEMIHRASRRSAKASFLLMNNDIGRGNSTQDQRRCDNNNVVIVGQEQTNPLKVYEHVMTMNTTQHGLMPSNCHNQSCIPLIYMDDNTIVEDDDDEWFYDVLDVVSSTLLYNYAQSYWYYFMNIASHQQQYQKTVALHNTYRVLQLAESIISKFFKSYDEMMFHNTPTQFNQNGLVLVSLLISRGIIQTSYLMSLPTSYQERKLLRLQELIKFMQEQKIYQHYIATAA